MTANLLILGQVIREERENRRLSQEALASLAGLSRTHIGEIERGVASLSFSTLHAIADGLSMQISEIVLRYERRTKQ